MGATIKEMHAYFQYKNGNDLLEQPKQVLSLAEKVISPIIEYGLPNNLTHLIVATSCPDMLAPSLGQLLIERFNETFLNCHSIDVVQGCTGGVSAMILGSQLSLLNKSSVLVVAADAAKKATSKSKTINKMFGNGSFACLINFEESTKRLVHYKSRQYKGLSEVVTIKLGHDADKIIMRESSDMKDDPRKHLGLSLNKSSIAKRSATPASTDFASSSFSRRAA